MSPLPQPLALLTCSILLLTQLGSAEPIRVACMGDSITFGAGITNSGTAPATWQGDKYQYNGPTLLDQDSYPAQLQLLLGAGYDVRNFGASGRTVTGPGVGLYPYLGSTLDGNTPSGGYTAGVAFAPDVILLMLGTNDTKTTLWPTSFPRFKADYKHLIQTLQNLPSKPHIVVCYPIPVEDAPKANPASGITESNRTLLLPLINEVIAETGAGFINTNPGMPAFSGVLSDQVHPNHAGAFQLAKIMDAGFPITSENPETQVKTVLGVRPQIAITSPMDRTVLTSSETLEITAEAAPETVTGNGIGENAPSATISPITKVEFFYGSSKFAESTLPPYTAALTGLSPGEYQITARATNAAGLTRTSEPKTIFVSAQPLPNGGVPFTKSYSQSFDNLVREVKAATLPWGNNLTLPGWYGASFASSTWTLASLHQGDDGGSNTAVLKSLGANWSRNRSLGTLSSSSRTVWGVCLVNASADPIQQVTIQYTGEQWRVSSNPTSNKDLLFEFSSSAAALGESTGYTSVPELTFVPPIKTSASTTKLDGKLPAHRVVLQKTITIPGGWQPGGRLWLRWSTGSGQSAIVAIEDLSIVAGNGSPEQAKIQAEESLLRIEWTGVGGCSYLIETSTDLQAGAWSNAGDPVTLGGGGFMTGTFLYNTEIDPVSRRFFRVRLLQ